MRERLDDWIDRDIARHHAETLKSEASKKPEDEKENSDG